MNQTEQFSALAWLSTPDGLALLAEGAELPNDRLTRIQRLRKRYPVDAVTAAVEVLELRVRARRKFDDADKMFFTREGLEQSTGQRIAHYRAGRFPAGIPILDACCGIGGDALALADCSLVVAVDINPSAALCAHANAKALLSTPRADSIKVICTNVEKLDLSRLTGRIRAAFCDPSRRVTDRTGARIRTHSTEDYSPSISWIDELRAHFALCAAKVSPAADDAFLHASGATVEFLSDQGECKEAVLWYGFPIPSSAYNLSTPPAGSYFATVLRRGFAPATLCQFDCKPLMTSLLQEWLYEPDPAVIRAHLVPQAAALLDAFVIEPGIAYLTSASQRKTPFAAAYRILDSMPYDVHALQRWLRTQGRRVEVVKRRGVELEPEAVRKAINRSLPPDGTSTTVVLVRINAKVVAILCASLENSL